MDQVGDPRQYARCCTFYPEVSQVYIYDAYLADPSKDVWQELVDRRLLLPEGLVPSPYRLKRIGSGPCDFFRKIDGACGIYLQRSPICSTWFCSSSSKLQEDFWQALRHYLGHCEMVIRQWVLEGVGFDVVAYFKLFEEAAARVGRISDPSTEGWHRLFYEQCWQDWLGREWELFANCHQYLADHMADVEETLKARKLLTPSSFSQAVKEHLGPYDRDMETIQYGSWFDLKTNLIVAQKRLESG